MMMIVPSGGRTMTRSGKTKESETSRVENGDDNV